MTLPVSQTIVIASYNGGSQSSVTNLYNSAGMLTSAQQKSGSTVLQTTTTTYNVLQEPLTVTTTDGSGNILASSTYGYDGKPLPLQHQASLNTRRCLELEVIKHQLTCRPVAAL